MIQSPRKIFLTYILLIQIIISLIVKLRFSIDSAIIFNKNSLVANQFKSLFFISLVFVIVSIFLSFRENYIRKTNFNGTLGSLLALTPFILLVLLSLLLQNTNYFKYVETILSYTFFHLGGFQLLIVNIFGINAIANIFYSLNLTIVIHILGFFIGDILYLIKNKIYKVRNLYENGI